MNKYNSEGYPDPTAYYGTKEIVREESEQERRIRQEMGVESCWELDAEDLENIKNNGGRVYLYIQGAVVPPVLLTTESMVFFKEGDGQNE